MGLGEVHHWLKKMKANSVAFATICIGLVYAFDFSTPDNRAAFRCEACHTFCKEFEEHFSAKASDDHYHLAVNDAKASTLGYRWDSNRKVLRHPDQRFGDDVTKDLIQELEKQLLSHYNVDVILRALNAAGHLQTPPAVPSPFCHRILCLQRTKVCAAQSSYDKKPYGTLTRDFQHLLHVFDEHHTEPEIHHPLNRGMATNEHPDAHQRQFGYVENHAASLPDPDGPPRQPSQEFVPDL